MARPKPHGTAAASTSPTWPLRLILTLKDENQQTLMKNSTKLETIERLKRTNAQTMKEKDKKKLKIKKKNNIFNIWIIIVKDKANEKWHLIWKATEFTWHTSFNKLKTQSYWGFSLWIWDIEILTKVHNIFFNKNYWPCSNK